MTVRYNESEVRIKFTNDLMPFLKKYIIVDTLPTRNIATPFKMVM